MAKVKNKGSVFMLMNLEGDLSKARKKAGKKKSLLKPFLKTKPEYFIVSVAAK
ncbi:hypothetical protein [Baileyella intestinalis]|uniref:hypothetical protein n=1 Tax=Baileyella intestinalis TaxID=2606709 RepID=UPI003A8954CA